MNTKERIIYALQLCEEEFAQNGTSRYYYLSSIIKLLTLMRDAVDDPNMSPKGKYDIGKGLFRVVSECDNLLESELGKAIVDADNAYTRQYPRHSSDHV